MNFNQINFFLLKLIMKISILIYILIYVNEIKSFKLLFTGIFLIMYITKTIYLFIAKQEKRLIFRYRVFN